MSVVRLPVYQDTESLPPADTHLEATILAYLLDDWRQDKAAVLGKLDRRDFSTKDHRGLFQAFKALAEAEKPLSLMSLAIQLKDMPSVLDGRKPLELTAPLGNIPAFVGNIHYHVEELKKVAVCRHAWYTGQRLISESQQGAPNRVLRLANSLTSWAEKRLAVDAPVSLADDCQSVLQKMRERAAIGGLPGLSTGMPQLDNLTLGIEHGLWVVGARPGMGKTQFVLNVAQHLCRQDIPVGIISLEMGKEALIRRLAAQRSGLCLEALRLGRLSGQEWLEVEETLGEIGKYPLAILDRTGTNLDAVVAEIRRLLTSKRPPKLIIVDHLQLLTIPDKCGITEVVGRAANALLALSLQYNVPIIAVSQLNRDTARRQDKRPNLADLRNAGEIEQNAEVVILIHREGYYNQEISGEEAHRTELIVAKNRDGGIGTAEVCFNWFTGAFHQDWLAMVAKVKPPQRGAPPPAPGPIPVQEVLPELPGGKEHEVDELPEWTKEIIKDRLDKAKAKGMPGIDAAFRGLERYMDQFSDDEMAHRNFARFHEVWAEHFEPWYDDAKRSIEDDALF